MRCACAHAAVPAMRFFVNESLVHRSGVAIGIECSKSSDTRGLTLKRLERDHYRQRKSGLCPQMRSWKSPRHHTIAVILPDSRGIYRLVLFSQMQFSVGEVEIQRRLHHALESASR